MRPLSFFIFLLVVVFSYVLLLVIADQVTDNTEISEEFASMPETIRVMNNYNIDTLLYADVISTPYFVRFVMLDIGDDGFYFAEKNLLTGQLSWRYEKNI